LRRRSSAAIDSEPIGGRSSSSAPALGTAGPSEAAVQAARHRVRQDDPVPRRDVRTR
jgi:hypothetical protein